MDPVWVDELVRRSSIPYNSRYRNQSINPFLDTRTVAFAFPFSVQQVIS